LIQRLLLSCGEPSGDLYSGALTRELRALAPGIDVSGLGGQELARAGGRVIVDYRGLAVTGFMEIVTKVPQLLAAKRQLVAAARESRPGALVVIDYFGFNYRLARDVKALGIPIVYYVSPQVWAWRPGRIHAIRAIADRVLVIFPFEEALYRKAGIPVQFVGHPLVDLARAQTPRPALLTRLGLDPEAPTVAVLPGSRSSEVRRILPTLVEATRLIRASVPRAQCIVAGVSRLDRALYDPARRLDRCAIVEDETDSVLGAADVALTASGTATVQAALHDVPMVVVYRVSPMEYRIGRRFVNVDTFAMVNLLAGERIVPELIQDAMTPQAVAAEAVSMLTDSQRADRIRAGLAEVRRTLGKPGASRRAAEAILRVMAN
jgi:lipid-A-disaccharide synthase